MGEDGNGLHPELEPLVEMLTVQHPAPDVLSVAGDVALVDPVVAAVPVSAPLLVLLVALVVRLLAARPPEQSALITVCATRALVTEGLAHFAGDAVHLVHISGAELRGPVTELREVALVLGVPAHCPRGLGLTCLEVAALTLE